MLLKEENLSKKVKDFENQIKALEQEISSIRLKNSELRNKLLDQDPEYNKLKKELSDIWNEIETLKNQFRRFESHWVAYGDDVEKEVDEIVFNKELEAKYAPRIAELEAKTEEIEKRIKEIEYKVELEVEAQDLTPVKKQGIFDIKNNITQLKKDLYEREKENLNTIFHIFNEHFEEVVHLSDKITQIQGDYAYTYITIITSEEVTDDDFDFEDLEFRESAAENYLEDFLENLGLDDFYHDQDWHSSGNGSYITNIGEWEVCEEPDLEWEGNPEISNYSYDAPSYYDPGGCDYDLENTEIELRVCIPLRLELYEHEIKELELDID